MRRTTLLLATFLVLVPACGGGDTIVSEAAAIQLEPAVEAVRQAAAEGSPEAAIEELADLRRLVDELSGAGELGEDEARRILAAAAEVEANLGLLTSTPTIPATTVPPATTVAPTTTVPATTTTDPPPPPPEDKEKKGEGEGNEDDDEEDEGPPRPPGNGNRPRD